MRSAVSFRRKEGLRTGRTLQTDFVPSSTIQTDGMGLANTMSSVHVLRPKTPDSEKITINLGYVDLGHFDLVVQDGFYANRTDFIRAAIRNQLDRQASAPRR